MLPVGTAIAGYRIERFLGRGGMGVVYEATQVSLQRAVALKLLGRDATADEGAAERFRREALLQATLDHPNIVTVYEAGTSDEGLFIAMRLIRGPTLKELIRAGEVDAAETLRLLRPVAEALESAHEAGMVHRDVKPQNILVGPRRHVYLADFGLVRTEQQSAMTATGTVVGTPDYLSPEQVMGEVATPASDVFGLAVVLYECLTGELPFAADTPAAAMYARLSQTPTPPSERRPELPQGVDDALAPGLARDPAERPSPAQLVGEVEHALGGVRATTRPAAPRAPRVRAPRRGWIVAGLASVGMAAAVAVAFAVLPRSGAHVPPPKPQRLSVGRPVVTPMTRRQFLSERRIGTGSLAAAVRREPGVAIESNLHVRGYGERLKVICAVRDLTARRDIATQVISVRGKDDTRATSPCWVGLRPRSSHDYRASVSIWRPGRQVAPLVARTADFHMFVEPKSLCRRAPAGRLRPPASGTQTGCNPHEPTCCEQAGRPHRPTPTVVTVPVLAADVAVSVTGDGHVDVSPAGERAVVCPAACASPFPAYDLVTFEARPGHGAFRGWRDGCLPATERRCVLDVLTHTSIGARF